DSRTGEIRAMVGGRDFKTSQFNRAIQAKRQPGSAFKPFIYSAALDQGITPTDILSDSPLVYYNNGHDWKLIGKTTDFSDISEEFKEKIDFEDPMQIWVPKNYKNDFKGDILIRQALEKSINICAVQLLYKIGPATAAYYARRLGIKSPIDPYLSMALGSFVVTPLEITNAYATFANQGIKTKPYAIIRIFNNEGKLLEEHFPEVEEAISAQTAYLTTNLLKGVIKHGTGWKARVLKHPAAGKTGTTNDFTDAWFIGYTPLLTAGVWVGYDDYTPLGDKKSGGVVACPIWTDFMKKVLKDMPIVDFPIPPKIVFVPVNKNTGLLALELDENSYIEAFLQGTEPKEYSMTEPEIPEAPQEK
ncbi:penicillin-binding transpeptidase domain-containing protein, partial [bacterium]